MKNLSALITVCSILCMHYGIFFLSSIKFFLLSFLLLFINIFFSGRVMAKFKR